MARVTFTSSVQKIRGSIRGDTFKGYKQGTALQTRAVVPRQFTEYQALRRAQEAYCVNLFLALTEPQKNAWTLYGASFVPPIAGINAFVKINMRILSAGTDVLVLRTTPPPYPVPITSTADFDFFYEYTNRIAFYWLPSTEYGNYNQIQMAHLPGYSYYGKEAWSILGSIPPLTQKISMTNPFIGQIPIACRMRTLHEFGFISPWTSRRVFVPEKDIKIDTMDVALPDWTFDPSDVLEDTTRIEGDGSLQDIIPKGTAYDAYALKTFSPVQDWTGTRYVIFYLLSDVNGIGLSGNTCKLQGDTGYLIWNYDHREHFWRRIVCDLDNPDAVEGTFDITKVVTFRINFDLKMYDDYARTFYLDNLFRRLS